MITRAPHREGGSTYRKQLPKIRQAGVMYIYPKITTDPGLKERFLHHFRISEKLCAKLTKTSAETAMKRTVFMPSQPHEIP
jgi:hypothetical protein